MKNLMLASLVAAFAIAAGCANNTEPKKPDGSAGLDRVPVTEVATSATPAPAQPRHPAPVRDTTITDTPATDPGLSTTPTAAPTAGASASAAGGRKYTVKAGDTLWKIAERSYGSGKQYPKIVAANPGLAPDKLKVGQTIVIP